MFDLEKFKTGKYFVHLPTKEMYDKAVEFLEREGFCWVGETSMKAVAPWISNSKHFCMRYDINEKLIDYSSYGYYREATDYKELPINKRFEDLTIDELIEGYNDIDYNSNEEHYTRLMFENRAIYLDKNKKYGDAFADTIKKYGYISSLTRMHDKFNRIEEFTIKGFEDEEESLRDSLMDLANYCYMYVMELENEDD